MGNTNTPLSLWNFLGNGIRQQHGAWHATRKQKLPSLQLAWEKALDFGSIRRSNCFWCSVHHCVARRERTRIRISRLVLQSGFSTRYLFHLRQHHVLEILYRVGQCVYERATDRVLAEWIATKKPVTEGKPLAAKNRFEHRGGPSDPETDIYRVME